MNRALLLRGPWSRQEAFRSIPALSRFSMPHHCRPSRSFCNTNPRPFSLTPRFQQSKRPSNTPAPRNETIELGETAEESKDSSAPSQHIPWYLQETPVPESRQVSSRDQIPELPEHPPQILPVLLDYTFKDLGLDELKLYDLRSLETPPALGANVIMIIATARSTKHLNVAADRLCRWLRSTYKLSPYADGLLGRNELKIKLRRKARRARVASRSGALFDEKDDGITTGWICVNAGVVERSSVEEQQLDQFEGFGSTTAGTRVVVQIFTEEKRAEVDLDGLWQKSLDRADRERARVSKTSSDASPEEVRLSTETYPSPADRTDGFVPRSTVSLPFEQRRSMHSSHCLRSLEQAADDMQAKMPPRSPTQSMAASKLSTDSLLDLLSQLPDEKARGDLGNGLEDRESTSFLQLFHKQMSQLPEEEAAIAKIKLLCTAISLRHPAYPKQNLWKAFMECSAFCYPISDTLGLQVVSALLTTQNASIQTVETQEYLTSSDRELALLVLDHLSLSGTSILNMQVLNMIYKASKLPTKPEPNHPPSTETRKTTLSRLLDTINPPFDRDSVGPFMTTLFQNGDYDAFWKLWRKLSLRGIPRNASDYEMLFRLHADLGDVTRARDCVNTWVPMMSREDPVVPVKGQVARNIARCVALVDAEISLHEKEGAKGGLVRPTIAQQEMEDDK